MRTTQYPSDLTDAEWKLRRRLLPPRPTRGRPPTGRRQVIDAILCRPRAGCAWRMLPREFGPWSPLYDIFRRGVTAGLWERFQGALHARLRQAEGRQPAPTAAVLDSQTVKLGTQGGPCGYDAGKKIAGRNRHILVDRRGLLLGGLVGPADQQDRDGAQTPLERCVWGYGWLAPIWAAGGYAGGPVDWGRPLRPADQSICGSCAGTTPNPGSPSCPSVGWASAPSLGSADSGGWPAIMRPKPNIQKPCYASRCRV
jgi:putative transposase